MDTDIRSRSLKSLTLSLLAILAAVLALSVAVKSVAQSSSSLQADASGPQTAQGTKNTEKIILSRASDEPSR